MFAEIYCPTLKLIEYERIAVSADWQTVFSGNS
jgi:hypothetical protein